MTAPSPLAPWLDRCPLVAILRGVKPEEVEGVAAALADAGFAIVEVPLNSPRPFESIARLAARFGSRLLVGAGTVLDPADAHRVAGAGGKLVVMPHADVAVVSAAKREGCIVVPGIATPTEAFAALRAGADGLKLFPAEASSPAILKAMRAVLPPATPILPVGGVAADAAYLRNWMDAGAAGFGVGSSLYKPGVDAAAVAERAAAFKVALAAARA